MFRSQVNQTEITAENFAECKHDGRSLPPIKAAVSVFDVGWATSASLLVWFLLARLYEPGMKNR
jgi:hypothetical protein